MTQLLILDQISQHLDQTSFGGLPVKTFGLQVEWLFVCPQGKTAKFLWQC
ncbi:hypothetical protein ACNPQK_09925 [Acinetobacter guillouiae]|jgi:hypothetical protein|nr:MULTISPECIES: hypothetical protein [unclassified Acinetobacter]MCT9978653.1 hypothetical protein [Acinetobacter sp. I-MWF]QLD60379.1 hypothetical protein CQZ96_003505 [Acinetobacter sp. MYb10]